MGLVDGLTIFRLEKVGLWGYCIGNSITDFHHSNVWTVSDKSSIVSVFTLSQKNIQRLNNRAGERITGLLCVGLHPFGQPGGDLNGQFQGFISLMVINGIFVH